MKNYSVVGLFLLISGMIFAQNKPEIPSGDKAITSQRGNILTKAMHNFKMALHNWNACLARHEGCTPQNRALLVEATNVLIEQILLEVVYTGATIGARLTTIKSRKPLSSN